MGETRTKETEDSEEIREKLWSIRLSGLSGMNYKVIAKNFDEAFAKTRKLAEQVAKQENEGFIREIESICLEEADLV